MLDPNGIRLSTSTGDVQWPSVAFDGTHYLVVWTSAASATAGEIFGTIVATDGTVVASDIPITTTGNAYFRVVSIAFDGTNFLIAWRTATHHIRAIRVARSGATLTSLDGTGGFAVTSTTADYYPWVTFGSGQYLVAWHTGRNPSWRPGHLCRADQHRRRRARSERVRRARSLPTSKITSRSLRADPTT